MIGISMFGHLVLVAGVILLLAWAIKTLHGDKLKQAALWCIAIGVILSVLSGLMGNVMYMRAGGNFGSSWDSGRTGGPGWMMDGR